MGPENHDEFGTAAESAESLTTYLETEAAGLATVTGEQLAAAFGGLMSDVDRAALTGELADSVAESVRRAVSSGVAGWRDDDLAFVKPWGFDLSAITTPVSIWQGEQDRMVPAAHGQWLAAHIPGARLHRYPGQGHLSLFDQMPRIIDDLADLNDSLVSSSRCHRRTQLGAVMDLYRERAAIDDGGVVPTGVDGGRMGGWNGGDHQTCGENGGTERGAQRRAVHDETLPDRGEYRRGGYCGQVSC